MEKIRIVVVEDNRLLREGITTLIHRQPDLKVVAALGDSEQLLPKIRGVKPHLVLLDLALRNQHSLAIAKTVKADLPETKVIAMDIVAPQEDVYDFIEAGVSGFILKDATVASFLNAIRAVAHGTSVLPPPLMATLFSQITAHAAAGEHTKEEVEESILMTARERQVIALIADGLTNKEIGAKLHLSTYTIKSHVHNILEKLALRTRLQIAHYAYTSKEFSAVVNSISLMDHAPS